MTTINISTQIIRSAQQCVADKKDDPRTFFYGILFAANGDVVATNGKILFKCSKVFQVPTGWEDIIIQFDKTVPASCTTVIFEIDDSNILKVFYDDMQVPACMIDVKYPDYARIIPTKSYTKADVTLGIDTKYLGLVAKVFPHCHVSFHHGQVDDGPIVIKPIRGTGHTVKQDIIYSTLSDSLLLISPVKID